MKPRSDFLYFRILGILLCLAGITALGRSYLDLPTHIGHLWPLIPFSFCLLLLIDHGKVGNQLWGVWFIEWLGVGFSAFLCLFTFQIQSWTDLSQLWPIFPFLLGTAFCLSIYFRPNGIILSLWILGWTLIGSSIAFLGMTYGFLSWSFWPWVLIANGGWFLGVQFYFKPSIPWLVLGVIALSAGLFFLPFTGGQISWAVLHRYQSLFFFLLGVGFYWIHLMRGRSESAFYSTAMIAWGLGFLTLGGAWVVGWDRLGWNFWPVLLAAIGFGLVIIFGLDPKTWAVWIPGTLLILSGIFFFLFTDGYLAWSQFLYLWPTLLGIVGTALMIAAVAGGIARLRTLFLVGFTMFISAGILYLFSFWPVGLLAAGFMLLGPLPRWIKSLHPGETAANQTLEENAEKPLMNSQK